MKTLTERVIDCHDVLEASWPSMLKGLLEKAASAPAGNEILAVCYALADMLLDKNIAYGNSALDPVRIFSKATPEEQILVRLDDKLSRIQRGQAAGEDVTGDLLGYLILLTTLRTRPAEVSVEYSDKDGEAVTIQEGAIHISTNGGSVQVLGTRRPAERPPHFIPTLGHCQSCNVEIPSAEERVICEACAKAKGFGRSNDRPNERTSESVLR